MTRAGLVLLIAIAVLGPLAYGSTGSLAGPFVGLLVAGALGLGLMSPPDGDKVPLAKHVSLLALTVSAVAILQTLPVWSGFPANPIWTTTGDLIATGSGSISVTALAPLYSLGPTLAPLLAFIAAVTIVKNDQVFQELWTTIFMISAAMAALTLGLYCVFPSLLLIDTKRAYLDSFTGSFVNRNTAATYFGTLALMGMALTYGRVRELKASRLIDSSRYLSDSERRLRKDGAIYAVMTGLFCVALLLTKSRAGILCFLIAAGCLTIWLLAQSRNKQLRPWKTVLASAALITFVAMAGQMFLRASHYDLGADPRWCVYGATIEAIKDNFWFGTGLGTFGDILPAYRIESCGISGVWEMAHNTYLEGLLTLGAVFIPITLAFFWLLIRTYRKGLRRRRRLRHIPATCLAIIGLIALHAAFDFSGQILGFGVFAGVLLGSGAAISLRRRAA